MPMSSTAHRVAIATLLTAVLGSTSCWLALGFQDQAAGTTGAGGRDAGGAGGSASGGPDGGPDGAPPPSDASCFAPVVAYDAQPNPTEITIDGRNVYWILQSDCASAAIMELPKVDGGPGPSPTALLGASPPLHGLASDTTSVWTAQKESTVTLPDSGAPCYFYSNILQVPLDQSKTLPVFGLTNRTYDTMALAGKTVAYSIEGVNGGSVWFGDTTTKQDQQVMGDAGPVVAMAGGGAPATFFWQANDLIYRADTNTMTPSCVAHAKQVTSLVVSPDGAWLYWTDADESELLKAQTSANCTTQPIVLADGLHAPQGIALSPSGDYVYWANSVATGTVQRVPASGTDAGSPTTLYTASSTGKPYAVTVDDQYAYATIAGDDMVVAIPLHCP